METGKEATIIQLKSVCLAFDELNILQNFDLKVQQGDSLVLVGPSGSGKSSLLKLMAGLLVPQSGQILYRQNDLSTLSKKMQAQHRAEVGMLFQQNALFDSFTVYENLNFVLNEVKGEDLTSARSDEIVGMLRDVGLDHVLDHYPGEISGGMQKRLGIARALVVKPKMVFYDDPTAGLDPITSRKIIHMILELKERWGGTIVTVTNDMKRAFQLAGEIMVCFRGEFVKTGTAEETKTSNDPRVQQFVLGQVQGPLEAL